jgi:hypothetical protein
VQTCWCFLDEPSTVFFFAEKSTSLLSVSEVIQERCILALNYRLCILPAHGHEINVGFPCKQMQYNIFFPNVELKNGLENKEV